MTVPDELVWLIGQLRGTASRRERIRLLARGWRTVRDLSPADRLAVAHELGFDGAEHLVEQLARRGGASPAVVLEMLERAEDAGPEQIAAMMRDVVDPERRKTLGTRFLEAARHWVADLDSWQPGGEVVEVPDSAAGDDTDGLQPVATEPAIETPPPPPAPAVPDSEFFPVPEPAAMPELAPERESDPKSKIQDAGSLTHPGRKEAEPAPEPESDPRSKIQDARSPTHPGRKEAEPEPEPEPQPEPETVLVPTTPPRTMDVEELERRLTRERSVIRRLRELAAAAPELVDADPDTAARVVNLFSDGWARRRAVEVLLRAGVPRTFDGALGLVAFIENRAQRAWALSTLIATRELMPDQVEAVLELSPSPVLRRRLERHRSGRRTGNQPRGGRG